MNHHRTTPVAAFLLRVTLGALFLAHASLKIFVFTLPGTAEFFQSIGLPGFTAYLITLLEVVGGLALIAGFYGWLFALPLALDLLGAVVTVHGKNGWLFTNKGGGWEYLALWIVALVVQFLIGDGAWSLKSAPSKQIRT
ncbi:MULTISPECIES: DoxX family protein [unclassified Burkholderia]|uniref:DoxX family protein n=1 Tax=unclassified Burkholderia TaxID=2613784 RepID=UPI0009E2740D|nr:MULTISPECIES: DoxX family protein [unclassified Burkholderia]TGN98723.1 DoxX family protein [Burkholderia sp. USMB20]